MIVLPQGGATRRPGFENVKNISNIYRIIPFEYNSTDTALIVFSYQSVTVWTNISGTLQNAGSITGGISGFMFTEQEAKELRYVQSGNVMFLAHKNHKPMILRRISASYWDLDYFDFKGGPFIDSAEWGATKPLYLSSGGMLAVMPTVTASEDIFNSGLVGTLMRLEYPKTAQHKRIESGTSMVWSPVYETKGTLNVMTTGEGWKGLITIQRSAEGGVEGSWVTVREYERTDPETHGQWDFTISETEENIVYRVGAQHYLTQEAEKKVTAIVTVSGFLKKAVYKITNVPNARTADLELYDEGAIAADYTGRVSLWSMGAWGDYQGYPGAVAMYQDRLIFAATKLQPQTIWMSRTGDYADFNISDPLKDDDAVTITLAGSNADGIHSLVTTSQLFAFTKSGEWGIKGAGDNGAITPSALTAHEQTNTGSKNIQPIVADSRIIMAQAQGQKIYMLGYDLNTDGYTGNEISILSSHIFEGKSIISMAYQKTPDSLIWVLLDDGTLATCTFNPEHEVIGWARHELGYAASKITALMSIQGEKQTEIFAILANNSIFRLKSRLDENYLDNGSGYESVLRTLRLNYNADG
ncbi:MAG: hypothetical protein IJ587_04460, partial [Synergistaceae bacterium]|nr:hypothetical protein [Synergistaceae bacterium]